jgi:Flp pilus assembly protein TadG
MRTQLRRNERGAALLETAITIPLILLISVGIFEFGRAYQTAQVLTNAAREGARIAILSGMTDDDVSTVVTKYMKDGGLQFYSKDLVKIDRNVAMGVNTASSVTIDYPFQFMVLHPVVQLVRPDDTKTGKPITMKSVALMRNE